MAFKIVDWHNGIRLDDYEFDMQAYMQREAESKRCSRAIWQNGRVVDIVIRL